MAVTQATETTLSTRALAVYEERWKLQLERDHFGKVIALEPESGDYVLGNDLSDVFVQLEARFGNRPAHIFRVGGGSVVKVGGMQRVRLS